MNGQSSQVSFPEFLIWFVFDNSDSSRPADYLPVAMWDTLAFSVVAAMAFFAIVAIDFSVYMVRRFGFKAQGAGELGIAHGVGTLFVILFGTVGALIVAFATGVLDLLESNAQAAIVTGITWQVVYAKLLERVGGEARSISEEPQRVETAGPEDEIDVEQPVTQEESEA